MYEFHPNLAKLRHLCRGPKNLAALYYLNPIAIDTLHNLIEKDTFTWALRIKVAFGIASLLRYMHSPHPNCPSDVPYLIRNIDAAHILVDQDYEALLFDFSMISGGILTDKRELLNQYIQGSCGYSDPNCTRTGKWSDSCDIFSYGVVLLSLISKRVYKDDGDSTDAPFVYAWAKNEHKQQNSVASGKFKSWLVHDSLKSDPDFNFDDAVTITNLAMRCVKDNPQQRPTMKQVVRQMLNLHIVKQNANTWECCRMLDGVNKIHQSRRLPKDNRVKLYRQPSRWHRGILINRFNDRMCNRTIKGLGQSQARVKVFSCKALIEATDSFSEENLIGKYQFGKVFRGEIKGQKVTVKIWETIVDKGVYQFGNEDRLRDEISLLQHPRLLGDPNLVKMIGYCFEGETLGAVYDLDPHDSLHNLAPKDEFSWLQRMKVIYELANLLEFLHTPIPAPHVPYRVGNIDAAHIILDKEYSPKLADFGMTVGGIILSSRASRMKVLLERFGYTDTSRGGAYEGRDIFGFGCILLCLIHKRVPTLDGGEDDRFVPRYEAQDLYEKYYEKTGISNGFSFVHKSLEKEHGFVEKDGLELTELGMECVDSAYNRPLMMEVVKRLGNLHVIRKHAEEMGIHETH
ncbi:uncharacterized protein [Euphorbia lathyris]|uniref:uncharacterized protein isoform X2 n=1 Tax=Euphorbia lathyris TaxID=212925 RepID=UPI00331442A2